MTGDRDKGGSIVIARDEAISFLGLDRSEGIAALRLACPVSLASVLGTHRK